MANHYTNTPKTGHMQGTVEVVRGNRGTINVKSAARHSGRRAYLTAQQWAHIENGPCKIQQGRHKGARKFVEGYELICGAGYVAVFATAHKASDLYAWACANGYSAETLWANSPCLRRANCA